VVRNVPEVLPVTVQRGLPEPTAPRRSIDEVIETEDFGGKTTTAEKQIGPLYAAAL
jgi:hypothetical protein